MRSACTTHHCDIDSSSSSSSDRAISSSSLWCVAREDLDMKPGAVATTSSMVAFSWEHEPGVSKQSPVEAKKPAAGRRTPGTAKKEAAQLHRLRVPPPPGGPGAPAISPPSSRSRSRSVVRAKDDPFLAAYLACTANGGSASAEPKGTQKLLGWAGIALRHGLGLSCKSSGGVVESMIRLAKIPE